VEGAFRLEAKLTPDDGATVLAAMEPHRVRISKEARKAGRRETQEAYAADALVALATSKDGAGRGPRVMMHVRADHPALVRGHVEAGEVEVRFPASDPSPWPPPGPWLRIAS
jgi:hypothetical protein